MYLLRGTHLGSDALVIDNQQSMPQVHRLARRLIARLRIDLPHLDQDSSIPAKSESYDTTTQQGS